VHAVLDDTAAVPEGDTHLVFDRARTGLYADGWLVGGEGGQ
jgi:hypothetical protein